MKKKLLATLLVLCIILPSFNGMAAETALTKKLIDVLDDTQTVLYDETAAPDNFL